MLTKTQSIRIVGKSGNMAATLVFTAFCVAVAITIPLSMVWKEVAVTKVSAKHDELADSVLVLSKEISSLRVLSGRLSGTERIESVARERLLLEYPTAKQLVILRPQKKKVEPFYKKMPLWAVLRKSLVPEES